MRKAIVVQDIILVIADAILEESQPEPEPIHNIDLVETLIISQVFANDHGSRKGLSSELPYSVIHTIMRERYSDQVVAIGTAICVPHDKFNESFGTSLARKRLQEAIDTGKSLYPIKRKLPVKVDHLAILTEYGKRLLTSVGYYK